MSGINRTQTKIITNYFEIQLLFCQLNYGFKGGVELTLSCGKRNNFKYFLEMCTFPGFCVRQSNQRVH